MKSKIDQSVLVLNACWIPIGVTTVKMALNDMFASKTPKKTIKIEYFLDDSGKPQYDQPTEIIPLAWEEWITLSPRFYDDVIRTPNLEIRIPTVIITTKYKKIPVKIFRPTKRKIYEKYNGIDYWTGEKIPYSDCSIDHVIPRSKGWQNTWDNLVPTSMRINRLKSDMDPDTFIKKTGMKKHYQLSEPPPVTAYSLIKQTNPDWAIFLPA